MNKARFGTKFSSVIAAGILGFWLSASVAFATTTYTVTVVGTQRSGLSTVTSINNWGQIAGTKTNGHAALWTPSSHNGTTGVSYDLQSTGGFPAGSTSSSATALNDFGQVVGSATTASGSLSWMWSPSPLNSTSGELHGTGGATTTFDLFAEPNATAVPEYPVSINNLGQIVGHGISNDPLMWTPDVANGTVGTWTYYSVGCTPPIAINDVADIAGTSCYSSLNEPYLLHGGLPPSSSVWISSSEWYHPSNQLFAFTTGMNQASDLAITALTNTYENHVYLYHAGTVIDYSGNQSSSSGGINNLAQIVGAGAQGNAMLFTQSAATDLNTLIPPAPAPASWYLSFAVDINDSGQIICTGTYNDGRRSQPATFLLTPTK